MRLTNTIKASATGLRLRLLSAHKNHIEAFAPFAVAVIAAQLQNANPLLVAKLSLGFILLRILYQIFYMLDIAVLRSLIWTLGFTANCWIFIVSFVPKEFSIEEFLHSFGLTPLVEYL